MLPFIPVEYAYVKEIADARVKEIADAPIERLVAQLGSASYREREAAMASLTSIGEPALETLRKAASLSEELEVRWRASNVIAQVEQNLVKRRVLELTESYLDRDEKWRRLREFIRPGMTQAYVERILGKPTEVIAPPTGLRARRTDLIYEFDNGIFADYWDELVIEVLDEDGIVQLVYTIKGRPDHRPIAKRIWDKLVRIYNRGA